MTLRVSSGTRRLAESGASFRGSLLVVVTWETAQPDLVSERYPELQAAVEAEPGCLSFEVYQDPRAPGRFKVVERYANLVAFDDHRSSAHFQRVMQERIAPLLTSRDIVVHQL
ncbi:putative quinol monooxygenase [Leucobacter celer]|uniref:putative quinol monooxygenase n=1 Tax=Leucobacter celer TaxID=668625 RepID=UPI0006A79080|nr:putative quinol monooxygenase [Leucobacter celer]